MLYLDTSALLKNYWLETGTEAVQELLRSGEETAGSIFILAETEAALAQLFREGRLPESQLVRQRAALYEDWRRVLEVRFD